MRSSAHKLEIFQRESLVPPVISVTVHSDIRGGGGGGLVSPTHCFLHWSHDIGYTTFCVIQGVKKKIR